MLSRTVFTGFIFLICGGLCLCYAQQPASTPPGDTARQEEREPVRILVEEVQIPIAAHDELGHFDPTLELTDILLLEDEEPQQVRSVRRIPASVLLLLDTGGELNSKSPKVIREIVRKLVTSLRSGDELLAMQFNNKVEVLQDWTTDRELVMRIVDTRLFSGKRARFSEALLAAADKFKGRPVGNRHVVMITDGLETPGGTVSRTEALQTLLASNATVHVISFIPLSRQVTKYQRRKVRPREKSNIPYQVIMDMPKDPNSLPRRAATTPGGISVNLDLEQRRLIKAAEQEMQKSGEQLALLADDTGGWMWLPETVSEMIDMGGEVARSIDAQYIVTYTPKHPLATARGEYRRINVISRRVGLYVRARRVYVVPPQQ